MQEENISISNLTRPSDLVLATEGVVLFVTSWSVIGNVLIIWFLVASKLYILHSGKLMISQAVADMGVELGTSILLASNFITNFVHQEYLFIKIQPVLTYLHTISLMTMAVISVNLCLAICYCMTYKRFIGKTALVLGILLPWAVSLIHVIVVVCFKDAYTFDEVNVMAYISSKPVLIIRLFYLFATAFVPLVINVVCFTRTEMFTRKLNLFSRQHQIEDTAVKIKLAKLTMMMCIVQIMSLIVDRAMRWTRLSVLIAVGRAVIWFYHFTKFFMYVYMYPSFRNATKVWCSCLRNRNTVDVETDGSHS